MKIIGKKILTYLFVAFLAISTLLWLWFKTGVPTALLESYISSTLEEETGYKLEFDKINFSLPLITNIPHLKLADEDGVFIEIKDFYLSIVPSLGSLWTVNIWHLGADSINLLRMPNPPKLTEETSEVNRTPNITITKLAIGELILAPAVTEFEQNLVIKIDSSLDLGFASGRSSVTVGAELLNSEFAYLNSTRLELLANFNDQKQQFTLRSAMIRSNHTNISANAKINLKSRKVTGELEYNSTLPGLLMSDYMPDSRGALEGKIEVGGTIDRMNIKSDGIVNIKIAGQDYYNFPEMKWQTNSTLANGNLNGNLTIEQDIFKVNGGIAYQKGIFAISNLKAASPNSSKLVNLKYFSDKARLVADVDFNSTDLKDLRSYLPFINSGNLRMKVNYDISPEIFKLNMTAGSDDFQSEFLTLDKLDINVNAGNLFAKQYDKFELIASNVFVSNIYLKDLNFASQSNGKNGSFKGLVATEAPYPMLANYEGGIQWAEDGMIVTVSKLGGKLNEANLALEEPITLSTNFDSKLLISAPELQVDEGVVSINTQLEGKAIKGGVRWSMVSSKPLYGYFTKEFDQAKFAGNLDFVGDVRTPKLHGNIDVSNLALRKGNDQGIISNSFKILDNKIEISSGFYEDKTLLATIKAKLPFEFALSPFAARLVDDKPIFFRYDTVQSFDFLSMIHLPVGHIVRGNLDGHFSASGTLKNPNLSGDLTLSEGKYSYKPIGLRTHNNSAKITASGKNIIIKDIKIGDYFNNFITGDGKFNIGDGLPFDFAFDAPKFNLLNNPYLQGEVAGKMAIKGNQEGANAKGDVVLGPLEIKIPRRFQESVAEVNITKVIEENARITKKKNTESYKLNLDIHAATNDLVWVRGWGVETQLKGKIHIIGSSEDPRIFGKLVSHHGKYEEFGKKLEIRKGQLVFDGPLPPSPFLNIEGVYEQGTTEIRLGLTGSILSPKINISSTPAMSQEEALSFLLFGDNPDNISAFQAFRLASSMRRLAGGNESSLDPIEASTKAIGIDDINIKEDKRDPNKTAVGIGKHISDKFYFEVEQGAESGTATRIEVELTPKITLEGTTEENGNNSLGINWKFDY